MAKPAEVTIEDAQIIYPNFAGKEGQFNAEGDRNFSVLLTPELAEQMAADGWNVKEREGYEEGDPSTFMLPVSVAYKVRPPRVVMIAANSRKELTEETVNVLDFSSILTADMVLNPYEWSVGDKTGIKAYLKTLYVTIEVDPLDAKYGYYDNDNQKEENE